MPANVYRAVCQQDKYFHENLTASATILVEDSTGDEEKRLAETFLSNLQRTYGTGCNFPWKTGMFTYLKCQMSFNNSWEPEKQGWDPKKMALF